MDQHLLATIAPRLRRVQENGQLSELIQLHAHECRKRELPNYRDWRPGIDLATKEIARALQPLAGEDPAQIESLLQSVLFVHPRVALMLELLDEYVPPSRVPTIDDDLQWNPTTGGPAVEKWEDENRQIALARANYKAPTTKERAW